MYWGAELEALVGNCLPCMFFSSILVKCNLAGGRGQPGRTREECLNGELIHLDKSVMQGNQYTLQFRLLTSLLNFSSWPEDFMSVGLFS